MNTWPTILSAVLAVMAVVAAGLVLRRVNWLTEETDRTMLAIIVRLLMPCLILHTTLGNVHLREAQNVFWPPLVGALTVLLGFAVAWLWIIFTGRWWGGLETPAKRGTFALTTGLYNYIYIPLPLIALLFPEQREATMGVLFVHNVGVELVLWTLGILLLSGHLGKGWWKRVINPPGVAVVLAILLNFAGAAPYLPAFLLDAMKMLGNCAIPLALLMVGAMVSDQLRTISWKEGWSVIIGSCLLRLLILPILFLALMSCLPVSPELKRVMLLQAAMPAAMFSVVIARYYHGDPPTAVRIVAATSLLSLLSIPLWLAVGLYVFQQLPK